jgi:hypothetical protein
MKNLKNTSLSLVLITMLFATFSVSADETTTTSEKQNRMEEMKQARDEHKLAREQSKEDREVFK